LTSIASHLRISAIFAAIAKKLKPFSPFLSQRKPLFILNKRGKKYEFNLLEKPPDKLALIPLP